MSAGYHSGEIAVQERAGTRGAAARISRSLQRAIPPAAADFLAARPAVFLGGADRAGRVWATVVTGSRGFARSIDPALVELRIPSARGDPLLEELRPGAPLGLLAIDFATRRRVRVNGHIEEIGPPGLSLRVDEVLSNCPKYIAARDEVVPAPPRVAAAEVHTEITSPIRALIEGTDTFFLASIHASRGADVSHRGGAPGFVRVTGPRTLAWPDYRGNGMFQSLGNLESDPRAGLLVLDPEHGESLHVTGTAHTVWDATEAAAWPGAERVVVFDLLEARRRPAALPWEAGPGLPSPFTPALTNPHGGEHG